MSGSNVHRMPAITKSCSAVYIIIYMMTSSNRIFFRVTGPLWGEFTGHRWIPLAKTSNAELSRFLWSEQTVGQPSTTRWFETTSRSLRRHCNVCTWFCFRTLCFVFACLYREMSVESFYPLPISLQHWGRDKMDVVSQTTVEMHFLQWKRLTSD